MFTEDLNKSAHVSTGGLIYSHDLNDLSVHVSIIPGGTAVRSDLQGVVMLCMRVPRVGTTCLCDVYIFSRDDDL